MAKGIEGDHGVAIELHRGLDRVDPQLNQDNHATGLEEDLVQKVRLVGSESPRHPGFPGRERLHHPGPMEQYDHL